MSLPSSKSSSGSLLPLGWRSNPSPLCLQALSTSPSLLCPTFSLALSMPLNWPLVLLEPSTLSPQGLCTCRSSVWSTFSYTLSIHSHLVNPISSKHHLLREACPDCHSWSTPSLVPFAATATYPLVRLFMRSSDPHLLLQLNCPQQKDRNYDYLIHCYFYSSWNHGHPKYMLNGWMKQWINEWADRHREGARHWGWQSKSCRAGTRVRHVRHSPLAQNLRGTKKFSNQEKCFNAVF